MLKSPAPSIVAAALAGAAAGAAAIPRAVSVNSSPATASPCPWYFLTHQPDESRQPFLRRSEEHTSELQSLMRISYAVFCLKKKNKQYIHMYVHHKYLLIHL